MEITSSLVARLLAQQFPEWAHLPVIPIEPGGHDNRTFRLGGEMLVRLPSAASYTAAVQKEQLWLPKLAPHLPVAIPTPLAMGMPAEGYPYHWSIYRWIEGQSADSITFTAKGLEQLAAQLARFLKNLHGIDTTGAPLPGAHNYERGASLRVYDADTRGYMKALSGLIDSRAASALWEEATHTEWQHAPLWVHGDFAGGNIVVKDGVLAGVIDFGCMAAGDPACDLVIAWTFLQGKSRETFIRQMNMDAATLARAKGWALWKACFMLVHSKDHTIREDQMRLVEALI